MIDHNWPARGLLRQTIMQHDIKKCLVNMNSAVIGDVSQFSEVVHKLANARASGADHVSKFFLSDRRYHALGLSWLAELSHDEQCAGEALLAVIEQLVDEVLPGPDPPEQDELQEDVRKLMLFVEQAHHLLAA